MVAKEKKIVDKGMHKKLKLLRSLVKSRKNNLSSVIVDASKYIKETKQKIETINQTAYVGEPQKLHEEIIRLEVENMDDNIVIKVMTEKACEGLLVFILEAFEEVKLDVIHARVSCSNHFLLEAIGATKDEDKEDEVVDVEVVKQTVLQAIQQWSCSLN